MPKKTHPGPGVKLAGMRFTRLGGGTTADAEKPSTAYPHSRFHKPGEYAPTVKLQ